MRRCINHWPYHRTESSMNYLSRQSFPTFIHCKLDSEIPIYHQRDTYSTLYHKVLLSSRILSVLWRTGQVRWCNQDITTSYFTFYWLISVRSLGPNKLITCLNITCNIRYVTLYVNRPRYPYGKFIVLITPPHQVELQCLCRGTFNLTLPTPSSVLISDNVTRTYSITPICHVKGTSTSPGCLNDL